MEFLIEIMPMIFIGVFALIMAMFVFCFIHMISPKARGKMMSKQVEAMKHMTNMSKDDMQDVLTNLSEISINAKKNILDQNEDTLKDIANKEANISKDAIKTTVSAVKEGWTQGEDSTMFCKHCGASIDANSKFCKECGKEQ